MSTLPVQPEVCDALASCNPDPNVLDFLNLRRSTPLPLLGQPGPDDETLQLILRLASRVPDHRRVVPWRFIVFAGTAKQQAAQQIGQRYAALHPDCQQDAIASEVRKFSCSPMVIALVYSPNEQHKTPLWEQQLSVGAVGQNLLMAGNAAGFAGVWLTYWYAFDQKICRLFGLDASEKIAGFFHFGTASENPKERPRPNMVDIISWWQPVDD